MTDAPKIGAADIARDRLWSAAGPIILWTCEGYNEWSPKSFDTIKEALEYERYNSNFVITRKINYEVVETDEPPKGEPT